MVHPPTRPSLICTIAALAVLALLAMPACYSPPEAKSDISYTAPVTQVTTGGNHNTTVGGGDVTSGGNVAGGGNISVKAVQMQVLPARDANFTPGTIPLQDGPRHVVAADLNHDSLIDSAVATNANVAVLPNIGGGKFGNIQHIGTPGRNWQVLIADMDGDGKNDLVSCAETYSLQLMLNTTL